MLVHPHLEYAAPIWDPHLIKHLLNCPKFCNKNVFKAVGHGLPGPTPTISPPNSQNHRLYLKLWTPCKLCTVILLLSSQCICPHVSKHYLYFLFARTNAFQSSSVPSSVSVCNHLPYKALTAHSINSFM